MIGERIAYDLLRAMKNISESNEEAEVRREIFRFWLEIATIRAVKIADGMSNT